MPKSGFAPFAMTLNGQVFEYSDIGKVALLVVLEALLSADNALILAIIVRRLPREQQKKALFYGLAGAFVLRLGAIVLAAVILNFWWFQVLGALYLIYLPIKHFLKHAQSKAGQPVKQAGFWATVVYAELTDLVFAIDSVLVAVALIDVVHHPGKIWVVYAGAIIGLVLLRFAAGLCLNLLERYPVLDHIAYVLVGWAGVKMLFVGAHTFVMWYDKANPESPLGWTVPELHPAIFWGGMALIVAVGLWIAVRNPKEPTSERPLSSLLEPDTEAAPEDHASEPKPL